MSAAHLQPADRVRAIQLLSKKQAYNLMCDQNLLRDVIMVGFEGYSKFTDQQLLNGINSFAKTSNDYECQQFLLAVSAEKFLLE